METDADKADGFFDPVEEASQESFPASDSPAWAMGKEVNRICPGTRPEGCSAVSLCLLVHPPAPRVRGSGSPGVAPTGCPRGVPVSLSVVFAAIQRARTLPREPGSTIDAKCQWPSPLACAERARLYTCCAIGSSKFDAHVSTECDRLQRTTC
jgi:hypothetical protein